MIEIRKIISITLFLFASVCLYSFESYDYGGDTANSFPIVNYTMQAERNTSESVDHSRFEILHQTFDSAQQVTAACLSCHNKRDKEIMTTSHWLWQRDEELPGRGVVSIGKRNILNNFCVGIRGSEGTCTRCHIGYGWKDKNFDFNEPTNIDCLVCHDQTDTYNKGKGMAGLPHPDVNLNYVSQNVGTPRKENCGVCHFWGGGGNNVKHGDLDVAMLDCTPEIDIHMTTHGENMSCVDCHITNKHQMAGKVYALSSENKDRATCEYCHTSQPHKSEILNDHNARVACQTCHIPIYAKANSTKMIWDWSTAGRLDKHGKAMHENDADGNHNYLSIKGTFVYDDHVIPEYFWFNGIADHQLLEDKIDTIPLQMNSLSGSYTDKGEHMMSKAPSKIWPVKVHRGKQIYDTNYNTLIQPKLWAPTEGQGAYWKDFDWDVASRIGMEYVGQPYSGGYGFVETEMYWPLNHQVSPASESLKCVDCHTRPNGRLAALDDFYLPGRDFNPVIETAGISLIMASLIGVAFHLFCRIVFRRKCKISEE